MYLQLITCVLCVSTVICVSDLTKMCLHPVSRGDDKLNRDISSLDCSLDEFDNFDYIDVQKNIDVNDLCLIQLNIRGMCSKQTQLKAMIDNCIENRNPHILMLCETWLTPFSPKINIAGYDLLQK